MRSLFCFLVLSLLWTPLVKAAPASGVMPGHGDLVTMDFQGVELGQVVRFIAEMTRKNYVLDPQIKGKVTVVTPTAVSVGEAEKIFESILSVHDLTIVERDGALKIVPRKEGVSEGSGALFPGMQLPDKEEMVVSHLMRMQHVDANSLASTLKPLMHSWGSLAVHVPTNALIVSDASVTVEKILSLIKAMDLPVGNVERRLFTLRFAKAATVEKLLNALFADFNSRRRKEDIGVKLFSDDRTNLLIVVADPEQIPEVESLVAGLDHSVVTEASNLHLYYPRNSEAEGIAKVLTSLMGSGGAAKAGGAELQPLEMMRAVSVVGEKSTNTLVIAATPEDYQMLLPIIKGLDKRRLQVHVEALIVEVTADRAAEFGVEWRFGSVPTSVDSKALTGFGGSSFGAGISNPLALGNGMAVGLMRGLVGSGTTNVPDIPNIPALIHAFQSSGDANILATPNIVTMDGVESEIIVGQNIPIVSGTTSSTAASNTATPGVTSQTVERKDVGLILRVTPRVIEDEWLEIKIFQEQSNVMPSISSDANSSLGVVTNKRSIKTTVNLKSGQTIVLGGLIKEEQSEQVSFVPCLGGLTGVGELFKNTNRSKKKSNLMVFIRPVITNQYDELVRISEEKYRINRDIWGAAESKGSWFLPPLKPTPLPEFSKVLVTDPAPRLEGNGEAESVMAGSVAPVLSADKIVNQGQSAVKSQTPLVKVQPVAPDLLEKRVKPVTSGKPVNSVESVTSVKPVVAAKSVTSPKVVVADKSVEPVKPVDSAKPVTALKSLLASGLKESVKPSVKQGLQHGYALQVEYGDKLLGANLTAKKLVAKGYAAFVVQERERDGRPRYSVRMGHFPTLAEAQSAAVKFKQQEGRAVYPVVWRPALKDNTL